MKTRDFAPGDRGALGVMRITSMATYLTRADFAPWSPPHGRSNSDFISRSVSGNHRPIDLLQAVAAGTFQPLF